MRVDDNYVIQTIKENSIADISIRFLLFTIYKEIQIGFGKLLNQYKQKIDKIQNMTIFEITVRNSWKYPENWHP